MRGHITDLMVDLLVRLYVHDSHTSHPPCTPHMHCYCSTYSPCIHAHHGPMCYLCMYAPCTPCTHALDGVHRAPSAEAPLCSRPSPYWKGRFSDLSNRPFCPAVAAKRPFSNRLSVSLCGTDSGSSCIQRPWPSGWVYRHRRQRATQHREIEIMATHTHTTPTQLLTLGSVVVSRTDGTTHVVESIEWVGNGAAALITLHAEATGTTQRTAYTDKNTFEVRCDRDHTPTPLSDGHADERTDIDADYIPAPPVDPGQCRHGWRADQCPNRYDDSAPMGACAKPDADPEDALMEATRTSSLRTSSLRGASDERLFDGIRARSRSDYRGDALNAYLAEARRMGWTWTLIASAARISPTTAARRVSRFRQKDYIPAPQRGPLSRRPL